MDPSGYRSPYAPPLPGMDTPEGGGTPPVWPWYCAFAIMMSLIYLVVSGFGIFMLVMPEELGLTSTDEIEARIQGFILVAVSLPFAIVFAVAPLLPKKPWAWMFHVVLICLCASSCACALFCIPLLIHWMKPETKAFFGRT